jgi:hypothetical protein
MPLDNPVTPTNASGITLEQITNALATALQSLLDEAVENHLESANHSGGGESVTELQQLLEALDEQLEEHIENDELHDLSGILASLNSQGITIESLQTIIATLDARYAAMLDDLTALESTTIPAIAQLVDSHSQSLQEIGQAIEGLVTDAELEDILDSLATSPIIYAVNPPVNPVNNSYPWLWHFDGGLARWVSDVQSLNVSLHAANALDYYLHYYPGMDVWIKPSTLKCIISSAQTSANHWTFKLLTKNASNVEQNPIAFTTQQSVGNTLTGFQSFTFPSDMISMGSVAQVRWNFTRNNSQAGTINGSFNLNYCHVM